MAGNYTAESCEKIQKLKSCRLQNQNNDLKDAEPLDIQPKSLGNTDLFPTVFYFY